jgi:hypothetical protein
MYPVDERDKVVELAGVPQSSVGAPLPLVLSDEHKVLLAYIMQEVQPDWDGTSVRIVDPYSPHESLALVEFTLYSTYMFGAPNDEAFHGHPLAARGLRPYGAFHIENSSWIRQLERMNSVHPSHRPERFARLTHYVFAFHDSTFECVAQSFTITRHEGSFETILPIMRDRLEWERFDDFG